MIMPRTLSDSSVFSICIQVLFRLPCLIGSPLFTAPPAVRVLIIRATYQGCTEYKSSRSQSEASDNNNSR